MCDISRCPVCNSIPKRETEDFSLGSYRDGGYIVPHGRYICPFCGFAPNWGKCYSVAFAGGWEKNAEVWNKECEGYDG